MLKNFFITAWRNLSRNKVFTLLNITGLAIGITVCLFVTVWLQRELSFDNFHPNGDAIFRVSNTFRSESESFSQAPSGAALGAHLPEELASIKSACRVFSDAYKLKYGVNQFIESNVLSVDSNFFHFFGFKLKQGHAAQCLQLPYRCVLTEKMAKKDDGEYNTIGKTR